MKFLIFNGKILKYDEISFSEFYMEESLELTQKVWFGFGGIPLLSRNMELLIQQAEIVHIPLPGLIKKTGELFRLSKRMLNKNRYYRSGFIIFKLLSDGLVTHTVVTAVLAAESGVPYPEQGILVSVGIKKNLQANPYKYPFLIKRFGICSLFVRHPF